MSADADVRPLIDLGVGAFLGALAAREPTPGGGAAAALAGATGAALMGMVVAYALGPKTPEPDRPALERCAAVLANARLAMLRLADEDASAYADLAGVLAMPRDDPGRAELLGRAAMTATQAPLSIAATAASALRDAASVRGAFSKHLASDASIAASLLLASAQGGGTLVDANLGLLRRCGLDAGVAEQRDDLLASARASAEALGAGGP